jgi:hypothetical protein
LGSTAIIIPPGNGTSSSNHDGYCLPEVGSTQYNHCEAQSEQVHP